MYYPDIDPIIISLGPLAVRWYGLSYLAGFAMVWWLGNRRAQSHAGNPAWAGPAWSREHVLPKSFGFPNQQDTAYTDLHHIRPADRTVNSNRNNRSFDYATEPFYDNNGKV